MDGRKQVLPSSSSYSSSSSSFTSELFGFEDSSSSSTSPPGIFGSIFSPSSKVLGRESLRPEMLAKRHDAATKQTKKAEPGAPGSSDDSSQGSKVESQGHVNRDMSHIYQEQRVPPCTLSSSIYYGGQDIYNHPRSTQTSTVTSTLKKDGAEDDSESASRGNWWQESLYY